MGDYSWIPAAASAIGGLIGQGQQNQGSEEDIQLRRDAYNRALALLQGGGLDVERMGRPAGADVQGDPQAELAQRDALLRLQEVSRSGYDDIDRAAMNRTMNEAGQQERSNREAVLAHLDPGSGAAISARLQAQQSAANRENQSALDIAAEGRKRALSALGQYGNLSSTMRNQGFNENAHRADSMDAISKFNAETSRYNTQNKLQALQLANGAGGTLGAGIKGYGDQRARQTVNNANAVGNGAYAFLNQPGDNGQSQPSRGSPSDLTTSDPNWKEDDTDWKGW